jgi:hypothetical protein
MKINANLRKFFSSIYANYHKMSLKYEFLHLFLLKITTVICSQDFVLRLNLLDFLDLLDFLVLFE